MLPERFIRLTPSGARVERDAWTFVGLQGPPDLGATGRLVVPLANLREARERQGADATIGVWLAPGDDPARLAGDLDHVGVIAIHFPKLTDGRGYSTAASLRRRYGYRGELRAFGDIGRDQLYYLRRCGFCAFSLAPHHDPEAALPSLDTFTVRYQAAIDEPLPLFRRRAEMRA
ncbi:MAG TPA: DUF934 domain-containing protein [Usitatibacter sp.]|nr:DUF934 domain-containing protein [Usitatibacter sp.]